jgi:NAD(P)-dependent dehydrogenase (short-subunit alcohol dehydrogenase family)
MGNASAMFSVDLIGSVHVVNAFEGIMAPGGSAVLVASMAGRAMPAGDATMHAMLDDPLAEGAIEAFIGSPQVGGDSGLAYAWSKRGVVRLASRLAAPWGRRGLRINSVSPGSIDTPMGQLELAAQPMMSGMLEQTPAGRLGRPDEIAAVIDFLLSDDASYVTGTDVLIDGGIMAAITS